MEKFKYLILLLLSFFILFLPQAISAGSNVSEYWHNSICLQVYYSNAYIEDFPSIDIDYAYYDPYDEEEGEEEWEDEREEEKEIEIEPETVESQMIRRNKEKRSKKTMGVVGGVLGALTPLVFAGFLEGVQVYGVLLGVAGGGFVGSRGGVLFAEAMIPGEDIEGGNIKPPAGCLLGTFLGTLIGAASGATAGGLMCIGTPSDEAFGGVRFGVYLGAIIGGMVGGITGGIAGASITESFPSGREEANIVQKRTPTGRIKTFVKIPDSTGVKKVLVEVPKPPLRMSKIATELIVGTLSGYCLGGICELKYGDDPSSSTRDFMWVFSVTIGTTLGVYYSGSRDNESGSFIGTFFLNAIGFGLSYILSYELLDDKNQDLFKVFSPVVSSVFAAFAFNQSRRYVRYQGGDVGLLNLQDNRVILGNAAMYIHSDPFGGKEIAYGFELFKFKF